MTRKTVLIIGAGLLQVPAYEVARRMGIRSVAVDRNPAAPGMALADAAHPVDTRDIDGIVRVALEERAVGVVTLCTDAPVVAVAAVAKAIGSRAIAPEAAARATNKALMRDAFASAGAPIPAYRRVSTLDEARRAAQEIGLPVILKPPASSGSRGIFKVATLDRLAEGYAHTRGVAGEGGEILVEEFVDGAEVSVETLSFGGKHVVLAITDKTTTGDPYWVETGHVEPSRLPADVQQAIRDTAVAGLAALGVMDAAGHVEIKVGPRGPRLIEIGARLGGDFITTELVRRSTGIDMVESIIRMALGEQPDVTPRRVRGAAIRYLSSREGRVAAVEGLEEARCMPGVVRLETLVEVGSVFAGVRSSLDRPGFVIAEGADAVEADARAMAAAQRVVIEVAPG